MTNEISAAAKIGEPLKQLNWSKLVSQLVGFFAPALLIWLGDLQSWLTSHPALTPLAAVIPLATAWIAGRGTEKGSLGKKKNTEDQGVAV